MLHLRSSNGVQNIFSLDVYSSVVANTINSEGVNSVNVQYTPNSQMNRSLFNYYINLKEQATQKEYFGRLGTYVAIDNYPRSKQFFLYLDEYVGEYHINIDTTGLFDYDVYIGQAGANAVTDPEIIFKVNTGIALVHNDNYINENYKNSEYGVQPLTIPTTISYNG